MKIINYTENDGGIMFCLEINGNKIAYKTIKDIIEEGLYYEVSRIVRDELPDLTDALRIHWFRYIFEAPPLPFLGQSVEHSDNDEDSDDDNNSDNNDSDEENNEVGYESWYETETETDFWLAD